MTRPKTPINITKIGTVDNPATEQDIKKTKKEHTMNMAVFTDGSIVIVVGMDKDNNPIDKDGTLFGPKSERDIEDFSMYDFYPDNGDVVIVNPQSYVTVC